MGSFRVFQWMPLLLSIEELDMLPEWNNNDGVFVKNTFETFWNTNHLTTRLIRKSYGRKLFSFFKIFD